MIVSSIDGRLRAVAPGLEQQDAAEDVREKLAHFSGVTSVSVNTLTGSLLVTYNSKTVSRTRITELVDACLPNERRRGKRQGVTRRRSVRTLVNYSMIGSLSASVAAVYLRKKRNHVSLGKAFIAILAVHLYQNYKGLLK